MKLNVKAFALSCGILWSACILVWGWVAMTGYGVAGVELVGSVYLGYSASFLGAIIGAVWAFIDGAVGGAIFAWLYNRLAK